MTAQIVETPVETGVALRADLMRQDRPTGMTEGERVAYNQSYNRAVSKYIRDNGSPALEGPMPDEGKARATWIADLHDRSRAFVLASHPVAHLTAMRALRKYQTTRGLTVTVNSKGELIAAKPTLTVVKDEPAKPARKRAPRKAAAPKPEPVVVVETVESPATDETPAKPKWGDRKAARKALAVWMREQGLDPANRELWDATKLQHGIA